MYPQAASLLYATFVLTAIFVGGAWAALRLRGLLARWADAVWLVTWVALLGMIGGKLFSILERGGVAWLAPWWEVTHGYRYPGAILAMVVGVPIAVRRVDVSLMSLGDALAPPTAAAMAVVRLGCWAAGCCHGTPTALPWAVRFPPGSAPWRAHLERGWLNASDVASLAVHPLQLYFAVSSLVLAVVLAWGLRRPLPSGRLLIVFLVVDGLIKLGLEQLRMHGRIGLQLSALGFVLTGAVLALRAADREPLASESSGRRTGARLHCRRFTGSSHRLPW